MSKKNITVKIDAALLKQSRYLAVDENKSLSEWVACLIGNAVKKKHGRDAARRRALAILRSPLHLGGRTFTRDELHERS